MLHHLRVDLRLKWVAKDEYEGTVEITVPDSCYQGASVRAGLPAGMLGVPEIAYLTAELSHDGEGCLDQVRKITGSIKGIHSEGHPLGVTAFVVVQGHTVGMAHQAFPRR